MKLYLAAIGFAIALVEIFSVLPPRRFQIQEKIFPEGAIHVHSKFSHDGGGTIAKIASDAKKAGLDFVIVTDHNTAGARRSGLERRFDGVDIFVEMEVSTPAGHLISFFSHTNARNMKDKDVVDLTWRHFLGTERRKNMYIAVAHPSHVKRPWNRLDRYPDGVEIINFDSIWRRQLQNSALSFLVTLGLAPINPFLASLRFFEIYPKDFTSWDAMNGFSSGHFGFLGHDAHEKITLNKDWSIPWPEYLSIFKLASNMILIPPPLKENFKARKKQIYKAIEQGRLAVIFRALFPAPGNDWHLQCPNRVFRSGDKTNFRANCRWIMQVPKGFPYRGVYKLWKDGDIVQEHPITAGPVTLDVSGPGNYRLEIWVKEHSLLRILLNGEVPYAFYNPITLR